MRALPQLDFIEAIKLASSRILDFKGRSRRSEFWWWMLVVIVVGWIISMFANNLLANAVLSIICMFFGLSATARRLQTQARVPFGFTSVMPWAVRSSCFFLHRQL